MKKNYKFLFAFSGIVFLVAIIGFGITRETAKANIFEDFFKNFILPLSGEKPEAPTTQPPKENPTPLYKPAIDYERAVVEAVKKASPAVVSITISKNVPIIENCPSSPFLDLPPEFRDLFGDQFPQFFAPCEKGTRFQEVGGGSGFIISADGLILTNKHVVADKAASYTVLTNDGKKYSAKVLARDPVQDLAIIKIEASGLKVVELGDSDTLEIGQTAIAIGNALGEFRNTVSVGVISGLSRNITATGGDFSERLHGVIQTDAAINQGNSGGPLLNLRGQVVGINTAIASGAQSIGFAIPINLAKRDIQSVRATGEIQAPFLGVRYLILTPEIAIEQKLPVEYGALLRGSDEGPAVEPNSPAAISGLQAEDIILEVSGQRIDEDKTLVQAISKFVVGDKVELRVNRGGKEITLKATLGKRPNL